MSNQHVLKIHPAPLADLLSGAKTAEVRRNDRGFEVGDTVRLMEVHPETGNWTGAADHVRTISHIQTGYGLPDGMCVLSYAQAEQQEARAALATQPAAGEPVYQYMRPCGEWADCERSFYEYQKRLGYTVRVYHPAPPAAAHGDEYEIWSAAQLAPGEGIEDGAERIRALIEKPVAHGDEAEPSVDFAAWLIDHREGQVVTEEDMHEWLGEWYEQRLAKRA